VISTTPHTLAGGGNVVNLTTTSSGVFTFTYKATDNTGAVSNIGIVTLYVQAINQVVITEIMYDPFNSPYNDWKWIEIRNPTAATVNLHSLTNLYDDFLGNLASASIGRTRSRSSSRTWSPPAAAGRIS